VTATQTISVLENADSSDAQLMSSVRAIFQHWKDLDARPPTDEQLAKIWPPWNALPPDMMDGYTGANRGEELRFEGRKSKPQKHRGHAHAG
jgi:hypothetical protein